MTQQQDPATIAAMAADWHARLDDPALDWDRFGAWLAESDAHRIAYDRVALADAEVAANADTIATLLPANDAAVGDPPRKGLWRGRNLAIGSLGAVLATAAMVSTIGVGSAPMVAYATGPGEGRTIVLKDGSTIRMDRNTRLRLRDGDTRGVELAAGAAFFTVRHDPARPFAVAAGDYRVEDIGTRFDVSRQSGHVSVAVAEGQVRVASATYAAPVDLVAGTRLDLAGSGGTATRSRLDPASVGQWRSGRLTYQDAPLALVAADVSRYSAKPLSVDPGVADLRFSGVLTIGDGSRLVGQLQTLLPVAARDGGTTIALVARRPS